MDLVKLIETLLRNRIVISIHLEEVKPVIMPRKEERKEIEKPMAVEKPAVKKPVPVRKPAAVKKPVVKKKVKKEAVQQEATQPVGPTISDIQLKPGKRKEGEALTQDLLTLDNIHDRRYYLTEDGREIMKIRKRKDKTVTFVSCPSPQSGLPVSLILSGILAKKGKIIRDQRFLKEVECPSGKLKNARFPEVKE